VENGGEDGIGHLQKLQTLSPWSNGWMDGPSVVLARFCFISLKSCMYCIFYIDLYSTFNSIFSVCSNHQSLCLMTSCLAALFWNSGVARSSQNKNRMKSLPLLPLTTDPITISASANYIQCPRFLRSEETAAITK